MRGNGREAFLKINDGRKKLDRGAVIRGEYERAVQINGFKESKVRGRGRKSD
jgi:hypothetical protein